MIDVLPQHPQIVHLPLGLITVLPLICTWAVITRRRESTAGSIWVLVALLHALVVVSSFVAAEIAHREVHMVKSILDAKVLDAHIQAGERLQLTAFVAFVICMVGLRRGRAGQIARIATAAASVGMLLMGLTTGRSGGSLVYRHGAARAYTTPARAENAPENQTPGRSDGDTKGKTIGR